MTREILFRGKRLDNGEWIEGSLFILKLYQSDIGHYYILPTNTVCLFCDIFYYAVEVDPSSVGQYTGKMDVNGKKVFEHDILQLYTVCVDGTRTKSAKAIVQWWENDQCYVLTTKEGYHCDDFGNYGRAEDFEVIGNIHDNPELLEDEG